MDVKEILDKTKPLKKPIFFVTPHMDADQAKIEARLRCNEDFIENDLETSKEKFEER